MYNLDVGEHYYAPLASYIETERGSRGETPGALTFEERLAQKWITGRRYESTQDRERYSRASSLARGEATAASAAKASNWQSEMVARASRAASEMRTSATMASSSRMATAASSRQEMISSSMTSSATSSQKMASTQQTTQQSAQQQVMKSSQEKQVSAFSQQRKASAALSREEITQTKAKKSVVKDDISKTIADVHMKPWNAGKELDEANQASARARARIIELEKELEEITRKAMTTQSLAIKTAKQMAAEATREDEQMMQNSYKKSKKVMIESSSKMG